MSDPQTHSLMHYYLTMASGNRKGTVFPLEHSAENTIGRDGNCTIALSDPLCSRIHAVVVRENNKWWVRDVRSRNGTSVNGEKVDEAILADGHRLSVGSTEFSFHEAEQLPRVTATSSTVIDELNLTETIVKDIRVGQSDTSEISLDALSDSEQLEDLLLLYQLSIKLLGCEDPSEVVHIALDLLRERTKAAVVGFLSVSDDGQLKPKLVIPQEAQDRVTLSELLTEMVCRQSRAVWIANQTAGEAPDLSHYADAICSPLIGKKGTQAGTTLGAIHVYRQRGRFRQADFELTISVANIVAVALVRARSHLSLRSDYQRLVEASGDYDELVGESPPMLKLRSKVTRVAKATGCVMIRGESGTGKELVARAIHRASARSDRPLLSVNCAAIPEDLMESQLFGHKAGSFTGADRDHMGYFQQADLGTFFLDEVGEMTLAGQAKLLRILEGHPFMPVGSNDEIHVDVRVIAATNQDLQNYVYEKKFREDLYYRLTVFDLFVPPLRDRGTDVRLLVDFFLEHFRDHHGRPNLRLSEAARQALLVYPWPGNVRQLRNVIDSAIVLAEGDEISTADLALHDPDRSQLTSLRIEDWERKLIDQALRRTGGHVLDAARLLGIGRATLYRKIEQYDISR